MTQGTQAHGQAGPRPGPKRASCLGLTKGAKSRPQESRVLRPMVEHSLGDDSKLEVNILSKCRRVWNHRAEWPVIAREAESRGEGAQGQTSRDASVSQEATSPLRKWTETH